MHEENMKHGLTNFDREMGADEQLMAPPDFDGPTKSRRITDPVCSFSLATAWGFLIWLGVWSLNNGNLQILLHPQDYQGRICGVDEDQNGKILPNNWHLVDVLGNGVCVDACPNQNILYPVNRSDLICKDEETLLDMKGCTDYFGHIEEDPNALVSCGGCFFKLETSVSSGHCQPDSFSEPMNRVKQVVKEAGLHELEDHDIWRQAPYFDQFVRDLIEAKNIVIGLGIGGSTFLSAVMVLLLFFRRTVSATIWASCILVPCSFGAGGYLLFSLSYYYADFPEEIHSQTKVSAVRVMSYILWAVTGLSLVILICVRRKITFAVTICNAAVQPFKENVLWATYPFVQIFGYTAFLYGWTTFLLYLVSTGVPVDQSQEVFGYDIEYTSLTFSLRTICGFWYMWFMFIWTSEFIIAVGQITIALCISKWYFQTDREEPEKNSLCKAMGQAFPRHSGTAAVGSLVTKVVQLFRSVIYSVQQIIKKLGSDNCWTDVVVCCCQFCFFGLERCMKFVSTNAYAQTAIFGHSYCKGAHVAFYLNLRNTDRIAPVMAASNVLAVFLKLCIVSVISVLSLFSIQIFYGNEVSSVLSVTVAVALVSWFISDMFVSIVSISVGTIMQCFLCSEEMFGEKGPYSIPPGVRTILHLPQEKQVEPEEVVEETFSDEEQHLSHEPFHNETFEDEFMVDGPPESRSSDSGSHISEMST